MACPFALRYLLRVRTCFRNALDLHRGHALETQGPLGTLWAGIGLMAFYIALVWVNTLLGLFLTPLFLIPGTWAMDKLTARRRQRTVATPTDETVEVR